MSRSGLRVMHYDDDPAILEVVSDTLGLCGFEVTTTEDPDAVWRAADEDYDLFLIDMTRAEQGGISLCRRLREAAWRGPILVLSSRANVSKASCVSASLAISRSMSTLFPSTRVE